MKSRVKERRIKRPKRHQQQQQQQQETKKEPRVRKRPESCGRLSQQASCHVMISTTSSRQQGTLFSLNRTTRRIRQQQHNPPSSKQKKFPFVISYSIFSNFHRFGAVSQSSARPPSSIVFRQSESKVRVVTRCHISPTSAKNVQKCSSGRWWLQHVPVTGALTSSFPAGAKGLNIFTFQPPGGRGRRWGGVYSFHLTLGLSRGSSHSSSDLIIRSPGASAYNDPPPSLTRGVIYFLSGIIMTRATEESLD